jgi:hypothetical protein
MIVFFQTINWNDWSVNQYIIWLTVTKWMFKEQVLELPNT